MKNKHILIFNRSFWPDVEATGQFLLELCEELSRLYRVTVISGSSYYVKEKKFPAFSIYREEKFKGINIVRIRHTRFWKANIIGRMINWLSYSLFAFMAALKVKASVIIICTDPPFLGIIAMLLGRLKGIPFVYNCRDLFPDVAWALGKIGRNNFLSLTYEYLNKKAFRLAYLVVCLGQSMKNRIAAKGISEEKIKVIPDWVDSSSIYPVSKADNTFLKELVPADSFIIMHSGNIGLSQGLEVLLSAVNAIRESRSFYLIFVGEGAAKDEIRRKAHLIGMRNVLFISYQPKEMLSFSLSAADLHIVSSRKGMAGAVVPSKVYGILAAGRPYLAITDKENEAALIARECRCGLWAVPDDADKIADSLKWAMTHPDALDEMGRRARHIAESRFDKKIIINEWLEVLKEIA